jgi:hypothetical protein
LPVELWSGQFNITGGQIQEEGPFAAVFEGARTAAGVTIYVVAEPVDGATARLCDEVMERVGGAFGAPEAALSSNLLRALHAAHAHVQEWNRRHPGGPAAGVGVSCLAVRGDEAYLAQCGPALAVAHSAGRFRVTMPTGDEGRRPLGLGERPAPVFTRFVLAPGEVILLTFSAADRLIDRGTLISLVSAPPEEALPALYLRVRTAQAFGALYIAALPEAAPAEPGPAARPPSGPAPTHRSPASAPVRPGPFAERVSHPPPSVPGARRTWGERHGHDADDEPGAHGGHAAGAALGAGRDRGAVGASRRPDLGALNDGFRLPSPRTLVIVAVVVMLVLLLVLAMPVLARRGADERYQELLQSADGAVTAAGLEADTARQRALLDQAMADLREARAIRPEAAEVAERLERVVAALAALDGARELAGLTQLADLTDVGVTPQTAVELAVAARVYLLDVGRGKVLAFDGRAGAPPEVIFEEGRPLGAARAGKARHLAVVPGAAGAPGTLLVLDTNRRLFALAPDATWQDVSLAGADAWKSDTAITATVSALYVLDAPGERVWRLTGSPTTGYEREREPVAAGPALRNAVDLAINGVPVVATTDGRLLRLGEGRTGELRPSGLDRPLAGPLAPLFNLADGLLYVADRGNRRIVLLNADGAFAGQLVHRRLTGLRALALDEANGAIYAVCGQALLTAPMPR